MRFSVRHGLQNALFLTWANVEPSHGKPHSVSAASRKTAFCIRFLTEKRTPHEAVRETPRIYGNCVVQAMAATKHSAAITQVMQMDLLPTPFTLPVTTPIRATSTEKLPTVVRLSVSTVFRPSYIAWH